MKDSAKSNEAKPLRGEAAFNHAKREIAERNETTQRAARKVREAGEQQRAKERRQLDRR